MKRNKEKEILVHLKNVLELDIAQAANKSLKTKDETISVQWAERNKTLKEVYEQILFLEELYAEALNFS